MMVNAMAMTAADLSASAKPWEVQSETVKGIFEEFYDQGDAERAAGRVPMAMMDRNQPDQQANSQVMNFNVEELRKSSRLNKFSTVFQLIFSAKTFIKIHKKF